MGILKVTNLHVNYGSSMVVKGVDFEVNEGDVRVILGANGAGKTTIIKTIMGVLKPVEGVIESPTGRQIQGLPPHKIVRMGVSLCPERRGLLAQMSVRENLEMGAFFKSSKLEIQSNLNRMFDRFPILAKRQRQLAGSLSGGEQQMLAISRSLMGDPKLLLMDEPSIGLAPRACVEVFEIIKEINSAGVTILLVEQNARQALGVANWAYVVESGVMRTEGTPDTLFHDDTIVKAYLGG